MTPDGDGPQTLDIVQERYGSWIRSRVRSVFPREWEDLVQEVMLKLGQALPRMREHHDEAVRAVISRTVRSVCVDEMRRRARRPRPEPESGDVADDRTGPSGRAVKVDDFARLHAAAARKLSPQQRRILKLRFEDGLSFKQIAEVLDVPQGSVAGWYSRALDVLREELP